MFVRSKQEPFIPTNVQGSNTKLPACPAFNLSETFLGRILAVRAGIRIRGIDYKARQLRRDPGRVAAP